MPEGFGSGPTGIYAGLSVPADGKADSAPVGVVAVARTSEGVGNLMECQRAYLIGRVQLDVSARERDLFAIHTRASGTPLGAIQHERPIGQAVGIHEVAHHRKS